MTLSTPIFALKREARQIGRRQNVPLHAALNAVARREGYRSWSHLSAARPGADPLDSLSRRLDGGGLFLLAARPGQGKTLLALRLLDRTARAGRKATLFTLDYSGAQVDARLTKLNLPQPPAFGIDISDDIAAPYVIDQLSRAAAPSLAVIDFLQLLDQRRANPPLADQVAALAAHVAQSGDTVLALSQVDRRFDHAGADMPLPADIRQPNPFDLHAFDAIMMLHDGRFTLHERG